MVSVEILEEDAPEALLDAARIWAAATARRDGLSEPVPAERKVPGLRAALAIPGASLSIARYERIPVGFVVLIPSDLGLEVRYLAVAPSTWGRGVGVQLLDHVTSRARAAEIESAELWVLADNERAIAAYLRAGWVPTGDAKSQIDTRRTEIRLELRADGFIR